jgi:glycosyltransferase involved in cell wall biosynthesis
MGGIIYILNAIKVFNWLDEKDKPNIVLFYRKDLKRFVDEIQYPYLETVEWEFPPILKGYMLSWLTMKNQFVEPMIRFRRLDAIFPMHDFPVPARKDVKMVCWYADLQHKYYPTFFTKKKLIERDARIRLILHHTQHLVLSSRAVASDFETFFQPSDRVTRHIFHFASVIDSFDFTDWNGLRAQIGIPEQYFMVSNQFHPHKNHQIILRSLALLKDKGVRPYVIMTGKLPASTNAAHIIEVRQLLKDHDLEGQVKFLGVLSRHQQLTLMRYAQAVIQPSLFEGWSTVIEDAISLQTPVIASNIAVNIEQLGEWGSFFDPHRPDELADILSNFPVRKDYDKEIYEPYDLRVKRAAESLLAVFK